MTIARTTLTACLVLSLVSASTVQAFDWGSALSNPVVRGAAQRVVNEAFNGGGGWNQNCPQPVYRQPCPQPVYPQPVKKETPEQKAERLFASAQKAFAQHDYVSALATMDKVVELQPKNNSVLQFRSLVLFAQQDYQRAAADAYDALLLGPTWTWPTVAKLYKNDVDTYTRQYRTLSRAATSDDRSLEKHFLLAYHHLMLNHLEPGQRELEKVLAIQPNEPVSAQLLEVVKNLRQSEGEKLATSR